VHTLRLQLQHAHQQQQVAAMQAQALQEQLVAQVERLAYQSFGVGQYAEATSRYVETSQWEPARALEYAIKAATAAWYGCRYEAALTLLAARQADPGDTVWQHFVWGTVYHSLARLDAAQQHYEQVIAQGPSARLEAAWFNLGVVQALRYQQTHNEAALQSATAAVQQSVAVARATFAASVSHTSGDDCQSLGAPSDEASPGLWVWLPYHARSHCTQWGGKLHGVVAHAAAHG